ncbi:MAG: hypothetical protein P8100_15030 [bacterium]
MNTYYWKNKFPGYTSLIYRDGKQVGYLNVNGFTKNAEGELEGRKFRFNNRGLFRQETLVLDGDRSSELATISHNGWLSTATITYGNKHVSWKYQNIWHTRWMMSDNGDMKIENVGSPYSGNLVSDVDDPLLVLTGIYISNSFRLAFTAVFVVLFVVIIASS